MAWSVCMVCRVNAADGSRVCPACHRRWQLEVDAVHGKPDQLFDVEPFRAWLNRVVMSYGASNVAASVGVSPRRLHTLLYGTQVRVRYSTVDRYVAAFGMRPEDLYGWESAEVAVGAHCDQATNKE